MSHIPDKIVPTTQNVGDVVQIAGVYHVMATPSVAGGRAGVVPFDGGFGAVGRLVTGLVAGPPGLVRRSAGGRCERVATPTNGDLILGVVDGLGDLTLLPAPVVYAGGGPFTPVSLAYDVNKGDVRASDAFLQTGLSCVLIDTELIVVGFTGATEAKTSGTPIRRGMAGTVAAAHSAGAQIVPVPMPQSVPRAS